MGKATKKKKEQKADFTKTKLKVGKTKPTPANHTDTSFKSRRIALPSQALDNAFLEGEARRSAAFEHQLAMTKHYAENQRKDAVASLHTHLADNLTRTSIATALSPLITHLAPLILDSSSAVRSALLALLADLAPHVVPPSALRPFIPMILLYIQSAMTHIQTDIRNDSTKFLAWALANSAPDIVRASWTKLLSSYSALLGWTTDSREKTSVKLARGATSVVGNINITHRYMETLYALLDAGLSSKQPTIEQNSPTVINYTRTNSLFLPHPLIRCYLLPDHSSPFASLNLFGSGKDNMQCSSHDIPSRRTQFERYIPPLLNHLHDLASELTPSGMSRQPNQLIVDDLSVTIIRILLLLEHLYPSEDFHKQPWRKEWNRCILKMSNLIKATAQYGGSRRITREWEIGNFSKL